MRATPLIGAEPTLFALVCLMGTTGVLAQGYFDCFNVWNGPNLPNTTCTTAEGAVGTWNLNCVCVANAMAMDCTGKMNGGAFPGLICTWTNDSIDFRPGIWSVNCVCVNDSNYMRKDCSGSTDGHAWPGTPCVMPGSSQAGVWSEHCTCEAARPAPCRADLWLVQAHGPDSLPVPYVLWVWDLSVHGTDAHAYHWDFGDGTASEERYPTHAYKDSGPFELCLSIDNGKGCASKACRSVSVDNDGFFNGLVAVTDHRIGFTVIVPCLNGIELEGLPVCDGIVVRSPLESDLLQVLLLSKAELSVTVSIVGVDGRPVAAERCRLVVGRNELRIPRASTLAGTFLLKVTEGPKTIAQRLIRIG